MTTSDFRAVLARLVSYSIAFIAGLIYFLLTSLVLAEEIPLLTIDRIQGNNGILKINYTTTDAEGKHLSTGNWKYSTDGGATWILIDEVAISENAPKPAGQHVLVWDTRLGLNSPSGSYFPSLLFRMQAYDTGIGLGGTWKTVDSLENRRALSNVVVKENKILAIRGHNQGKLANSEEYSPVTDTWQPAIALPVAARIDLTAVADSNGIYLIGGYDGKTRLTTTEFVSFQRENVQAVTPMPTARKALSSVLLGHKIYVLGGDGGGSLLNINEAYNIVQDRWETLAPMNTARQSFAAVTLGDKIYAIGGHSNSYLATVEMYDPHRDVWREIQSMPTARYGFGATVVGDKIYAVGGHDGSRVLSTVEVYHPATDTWSTAAPMPTARQYHGVTSIGRIIYAVGGTTDSEVLDSVEAYILPRIADTAIAKSIVLANHIQAEIKSITPSKSLEETEGPITRLHGTVTVTGLAYSANLQSWTLDYAAIGPTDASNQDFTPIQFSSQRPKLSQLGQWDTTQLKDGPYWLRLRVTDTNVVTVSKTIVVMVDNTPAEVVVTLSGAGLETDADSAGVHFIRNNATMTVSGVAEIGAIVVDVVLHAAESEIGFLDQVRVTPEGKIQGQIPGRDFSGISSIHLNVTVQDDTGNLTTVPSNTLIIDNDSPRIEIISPAAGANFRAGGVRLSGKVADTFSGVRRIEIDSGFGWVLVDDTTNLDFNPQLTDWSYTFIPPTSDVLLTFRARATDNAGNIHISDSKAVRYMRSLPTVNLVAPIDNTQMMGKIEVVVQVGASGDAADLSWRLEFAPGMDAEKGWTKIVDGQTLVVPDSPLTVWDTSQLPDGTYTLRLLAETNGRIATVKRTNLFKSPADPETLQPPNRPIALPFDHHAAAREQLVNNDDVQLQSSDFSDPNVLDQHQASQWQITTTAGDYEVSVYDSGSDNLNLVQIRVKDLIQLNQTYYWRVRYQDSSGMWSEFSDEARFTTKPTGEFTIRLEKGLNFISLPVRPIMPITSATLAEQTNATLVMRFDVPTQTFVPYIPDLSTSSSFPLEGGIGYILNVMEPQSITFTGMVWNNLTREAPPSNSPLVPTDSSQPGIGLWAFVLAIDLPSPGRSSAIEITNLRSGQTQLIPSDQPLGYASFIDLNRRAVVTEGDQLRIRPIDANGHTIFQPRIMTITGTDMERAVRYQSSGWIPLPKQNRLLQNYPNPFNPETWIPYQLAQDGYLTLMIYDINGNQVRKLDLGHQLAGVYRSRERAVYWDGTNHQGERVGSGIYFYQVLIRPDQPADSGHSSRMYSQMYPSDSLKKMIILK